MKKKKNAFTQDLKSAINQDAIAIEMLIKKTESLFLNEFSDVKVKIKKTKSKKLKKDLEEKALTLFSDYKRSLLFIETYIDLNYPA